jgi:prolycopene isomerase
MPEFGFSSAPANHNSQFFNHHGTTKLGTIRPTNSDHKFKFSVNKKPTGFLCSKLWDFNSGFNNFQFFGECCAIQSSRCRPRSQKHKVSCLKHAKTLVLNDYQPCSMCSGFYSTIQLGTLRPRNSESKFLSGSVLKIPISNSFKHGSGNLGLCEVNWSNKKFVLRSKSVLSVDKVVEREESGGELGRENSHDAIVIGSGIGGLVAATQLAVKGARVLVLEKYVIPGGSSGYYQRDGYTFDVGSSVMFGFSNKVSLSMDSFCSFVHCAYPLATT